MINLTSKYNFIKYHLIYTGLIIKCFFSKITPFSRKAPLRSSVNSARNLSKLSMIVMMQPVASKTRPSKASRDSYLHAVHPFLVYALRMSFFLLYIVLLVISDLLQLLTNFTSIYSHSVFTFTIKT